MKSLILWPTRLSFTTCDLQTLCRACQGVCLKMPSVKSMAPHPKKIQKQSCTASQGIFKFYGTNNTCLFSLDFSCPFKKIIAIPNMNFPKNCRNDTKTHKQKVPGFDENSDPITWSHGSNHLNQPSIHILKTHVLQMISLISHPLLFWGFLWGIKFSQLKNVRWFLWPCGMEPCLCVLSDPRNCEAWSWVA